MASLVGLFCSCSLVFLASMNGLVDSARVFKVGDGLGWQEPEDNNTAMYNQWAERNRFQVGDSLLFEYKNDSVIEVDKWGYYHCNASKSIVVFNNGRSILNLDRPGPFYFISGAPNHCKNGQRLIVEVMGLHHQRSYSPPPIATPPYSFQLAPSSQTSSGAAVFVRLVSVLVVAVGMFV
ncbi:mavicyanin [Manihot esculenta]|uniref:mavicyanin n=1 Tax=Manihot esculenta TaxID=3983 RepID=UPI001CC728FF|nr:mavicyanin [Manihot esculenta]